MRYSGPNRAVLRLVRQIATDIRLGADVDTLDVNFK
jgi:hypothetical protein